MATQKEIEAQITRSLELTKLYSGAAAQLGAADALRDLAAGRNIRDIKVACDTLLLAATAPWSAQTDSALVASLLQEAHLAELHGVEGDTQRNAITAAIEEAHKAERAQRLVRRNELIDKLTGAWSRRTGEVVDGVEYQKGMRAAWDRNS